MGTQSTSTVFKVTAGAANCTFTNHQPAAITGLHIECSAAAASTKSDTVLAPAPAMGQTGQFSADRDAITWAFQRPSANGPLMYRIVANGKTKTGSL